MKKVILLLAMSGLFSTLLVAQIIPEGMNYQAVARNLKGEILANQPIALKVKLFSVQSNGITNYYIEEHEVVTSATGVFSLVIGKGKPGKGNYNNIPWSIENIWMEVSIKSKGQSDFALISNSKLLAVPYAYHSITAEKLSGETVPNAGVPAQSWLLFGNSFSNPVEDKLGTTDSVDLVMVTNDKERLRIYANGDIFIKKSLRIGANLTVDSNAYINRLGGATTNFGPFTVGDVTRRSPTLLSGTLTVDQETDLNSSLNVDGITDLNSKLNVNNSSPTKLTGTLRVDGITDLNSALNVNNISPTVLTGTLRVDKYAIFNDSLMVKSGYDTDTAGLVPSGSLQAYGGLYVRKNFYVGGIAKFGGPAAFGGAVSINDLTQSVSTTPNPITGALKVAGGVGIGRNLYVGDQLNVTNNVTVGANKFIITALNGNTAIAGNLAINTNKFTVDATTGNTSIAGATTISNTLAVSGNSSYIASFTNLGANGINIQVGGNPAMNANNFVTFKNGGGNVVGRIEGETVPELLADDDFQNDKRSFDWEVISGSIDVTIAAFEVAQAGVQLAASFSSSTACVGFGACVTAPIPSFIISAGTDLVLKIANAASTALSLANAVTTRDTWVNLKKSNIGVTYQSGSGDYAEWLPKSNPSEKFKPGYIVGIKNGKISLNLEGADKIFVISTKPIVLGNMPIGGNESDFEKVAFMGQVPVHVIGKVNAGDYILPSGSNNGFGRAVAPGKMQPEDYTNIVGVAWASSSNDLYNQVNVAIGLNTGDVSKVVAEQKKEINSLKSRIDETNAILAKLIPGFKEAAGLTGNDVVKTVPARIDDHKATDGHLTVPDASSIVYFDISRQQVMAMFDMAEKVFIEGGGDAETNPFWKKIKTDPSYKESMMQEVEKKFYHAIHTHKEINKQYLSGK
jgi:hypothetical protein